MNGHLSQTGKLGLDLGTPHGTAEGPDLRNRTPVDSPDVRHETTDQGAEVRFLVVAEVAESRRDWRGARLGSSQRLAGNRAAVPPADHDIQVAVGVPENKPARAADLTPRSLDPRPQP